MTGTQLALVVLAAVAAASASAHSASDAYLTFDIAAPAQGPGAGSAASAATVVHGQWDVALRDLDFVLGLDDDDDGTITWAEVRRHQAAIARYAYAHLHVDSGGRACAINPGRQMVDDHADGSYAVLFFDIVCSGAAQRITLDYRMFFAIDPSHRAIVVLRSGPAAATALLSPQNARIELALQP